MIKWMFNKMSRTKQKLFIVQGLESILKSKDSSIDAEVAMKLVEAITASKGNDITAFILRKK